MIEPSKLKEAFKKVEAENNAFRIYLKKHANADKLDEQFLRLHNELFANYDCNQCRNCCKELSATFEKEELGPVSAFLEMTESEFTLKYVEEEYGEYYLNVKPCCFLKEDGECGLETCKPAACRDYPYTDQPERLFALIGIVESTSVCPVVFEMFERLKKEYGFRGRGSGIKR